MHWKSTVRILAGLLVLILAGWGAGPQSAQAQVADDTEFLENLYTIHTPTAGILKKGQYQVDIESYGDGGLLGGIAVGLFDRFMLGVSFGGNGLIGYNEPEGNKFPGVTVRYRLWDEGTGFPATTIGFDMQGYGPWYTDANRYLFKAPGGFVAVSKNWKIQDQNLGAHFGLNINSVEADDQRALDLFVGADLGLNEQLSVTVEYDFALDDNKAEEGVPRFGGEKFGYLNAGLRFTFAQALVIEVNAVDLLQTSSETQGFGREIRLIYVETFTF